MPNKILDRSKTYEKDFYLISPSNISVVGLNDKKNHFVTFSPLMFYLWIGYLVSYEHESNKKEE